MPKKPYNWTKSQEFREIYSREKAYIDALVADPLFVKEWEEAKKTTATVEQIENFCKKWELPNFPRKLEPKIFCPAIGPPLEFKHDDKGNIIKMVFNPKGLTLQDIKRYMKVIDEYKKVIYGSAEQPRENKWRDLRWWYLYRETRSYRRVAEITFDKYRNNIVRKLVSTREFTQRGMADPNSREDIIEYLMPLIKMALRRERLRRK